MRGRSTATTLTTDSIERHLKWLSEIEQSENTQRAVSSDLRMFLAQSGQQAIPLKMIEPMAMAWLKTQRRKKAPATIRRYLASLRSWMKWAGINYPLAEYRAPRPAPQIPHPIPELGAGIEMLFEACHRTDLRVVVALQGLCGLRITEALEMRANHVSVRTKMLTVYGKGGKTRYVPISDRAWEVLLPATALAMCEGRPLAPLGERNARRLITDLGVTAGLKLPLSSHDLRATFATMAYAQCGDVLTVARLLGHEDIRTTQLYIGTATQLAREAVNF